MNKKATILIISAIALAVLVIGFFMYRHYHKPATPSPTILTDTSAAMSLKPSATLTAPHGDSTLVPVLSKILDSAFAASRQKDYTTLAALVVYRGSDAKRHGLDVFRQKNKYEKGVIRLTADAFRKWSSGTLSIDYSRIFELPQPDGRTLQVLEVIFVYPKKTDRKFFGFLKVNDEYKIADVTSWL